MIKYLKRKQVYNKMDQKDKELLNILIEEYTDKIIEKMNKSRRVSKCKIYNQITNMIKSKTKPKLKKIKIVRPPLYISDSSE